jgi:hypothetical protein
VTKDIAAFCAPVLSPEASNAFTCAFCVGVSESNCACVIGGVVVAVVVTGTCVAVGFAGVIGAVEPAVVFVTTGVWVVESNGTCVAVGFAGAIGAADPATVLITVGVTVQISATAFCAPMVHPVCAAFAIASICACEYHFVRSHSIAEVERFAMDSLL